MPSPNQLGSKLREVREVRGVPLKAIADPAGISIAYLQKLERGDVKSPSPHVLYRLAEVLKVPYPLLMELAGYVVPRGEEAEGRPAESLLAHALSSEELTDEEAAELARYLAWYRHQKTTSRAG